MLLKIDKDKEYEFKIQGHYKSSLISHFFDYVQKPSQSDENNDQMPSTEDQKIFIEYLKKELIQLQLEEVFVDKNYILYGKLPSNLPTNKTVPTLGFCAHVDTVDIGLSKNVHPCVRMYEGKDLLLNEETGYTLKAKEHPELNTYINQPIIFTDGSSVLGADDKAGVSAIITMLEFIIQENVPHGEIQVVFFPDEEIGLRGGKNVDLNRFNPDWAYTVDGGVEGEITYETFNAASVNINIEGISVHPMCAKGVMVNPLMVAHDIIDAFPRAETPENTENREGYYWFHHITSNDVFASLKMNIRDFDLDCFMARKRKVEEVIKDIRLKYPKSKIEYQIEDIYGNISSFLGTNRYPIDLMVKALENLNIKPKILPVRGGTDGSAMSARGLITPNIFTGGLNPHSTFECLPIEGFHKSFLMLVKMIEISTFLQ